MTNGREYNQFKDKKIVKQEASALKKLEQSSGEIVNFTVKNHHVKNLHLEDLSLRNLNPLIHFHKLETLCFHNNRRIDD